jgi:hypothetical protein
MKRDSQSGVDSTPLSGTGCPEDGKEEYPVCGQCGILFDSCYPIGVRITSTRTKCPP